MLAFATTYCRTSAQTSSDDFPFRNTSLSFEERVDDLVSRMTLQEKADQLLYTAPAIPRLGIPAYNWWNEALHGVARAGYATVFLKSITIANSWDEDFIYDVANAISSVIPAGAGDMKHMVKIPFLPLPWDHNLS